MPKKLHHIARNRNVGIYDNCTERAKIYADRTIVTVPIVRWKGNTGGYAEKTCRIEGNQHRAILAAVTRGNVDAAWELIEDEYLRQWH